MLVCIVGFNLETTNAHFPYVISGTQNLIRVPGDSATVEDAVKAVSDGGIIEIQGGQYTFANGPLFLNDLGKSFIMRAGAGQEVILQGNGSQDILRFQNSPDKEHQNRIIFDGITFSQGRATQDGVAGGVTIYRSIVEFRNCRFIDNQGNQPSTGGGALVISLNSIATITNCQFENNSAKNEAGAISIGTGAQVSIISSTFRNNRVDLPNHRNSAAGGAVHIADSVVHVVDSTFVGNRAGYVGGALYGIGTWTDPVTVPQTRIYISGSTFTQNVAQRDPSVSFPAPTEGGGIHFEDQTVGIIRNSMIRENNAEIGAGLNIYRAQAEVYESTFERNRTTSTTPGRGFGSAITASSHDSNDNSTAGGTINRPPARLTVDRVLIIGTPDNPTSVANGISAGGDTNHMYGLNGVPQMGTVTENRAVVSITNSMFFDTDVAEQGAPGTGFGGGLVASLTDITMDNVIFYGADAKGSVNSAGGAIALFDQSLANFDHLTIAKSSAGLFGGGIFVQGSTMNLNNCLLLENEISPGVDEPVTQSYGAAIFAGPDIGRQLGVDGTVSNCVISDNIGLPIYDDDRPDGTINDMRYNNNQIYSTTFGDIIYTDSIPFQCCKTVAELNTVIIPRDIGIPTTEKSQIANTALETKPDVGALIPLVNSPLGVNTPSYQLAWAWSGSSATLDNETLTANGGTSLISPTTSRQLSKTITHTLIVGAKSISATLIQLVENHLFLPSIGN